MFATQQIKNRNPFYIKSVANDRDENFAPVRRVVAFCGYNGMLVPQGVGNEIRIRPAAKEIVPRRIAVKLAAVIALAGLHPSNDTPESCHRRRIASRQEQAAHFRPGRPLSEVILFRLNFGINPVYADNPAGLPLCL